MDKSQESLLWLGVALVGGFVLGRWTAPEGTVINVAPTGEEPVPLPPVGEPAGPLPPLGDAEPGTYAGRWEPGSMPYDVEVYPSEADYTRISPPLGPRAPASAADCSIIAVPVGWWEWAGEIALRAIADGVEDIEDIVDRVLRKAIPKCRYGDTYATRELRTEIVRRIEAMPGVQFPPPLPPAASSAMANPSRMTRSALAQGRRGRRSRRIRR